MIKDFQKNLYKKIRQLTRWAFFDTDNNLAAGIE